MSVSDIRILRKELDSICSESNELDAQIIALLAEDETKEEVKSTSGKERKTTVEALLNPGRFEDIASEAAVLAEQIEESRALSERVSRTVRQLDEAQMNVQQALALVEDVVNLKGCASGVVAALKEEDLVGATGYVRQFHDIASVAAKASEDYERMVGAEKELQAKVLARFEAACAAEQGGSDDGAMSSEVAKYCALLGPLGLASDGVKGYLSFARKEVAKIVDSTAGGGAGTLAPGDPGDRSDRCSEALSTLFNGAAQFLQSHMPLCSAALSQAGGGSALLTLVHADIEAEAVRLLRVYMGDMALQEHATQSMEDAAVAMAAADAGGSDGALGKLAAVGYGSAVSAFKGGGGSSGGAGESGGEAFLFAVAGFNGGIEELTAVLEGVALVMQHVESYDRFVRHQASKLEEDEALAAAAAARHNNNNNGGGAGVGDDGGGSGNSKQKRAQPTTTTAVLAPQTPLNECLAELGGWYTLLEKAAVEAGLRKALALDDLPPAAKLVVKCKAEVAAAAARAQRDFALAGSEGGSGGAGGAAGAAAGAAVAAAMAAATQTSASKAAQNASSSPNPKRGRDGSSSGSGVVEGDAVLLSSSSVEDAFYVAQCCCQRVMASGHPQSCSAVVNHVNNALLSPSLFDPLVGKASASATALGQGLTGEDGLLQALLSGGGKGLSTQLLSSEAGKGLLGLSQLGGGLTAASKGVADNASSYLTSAALAARSVASKAGGAHNLSSAKPVIGQGRPQMNGEREGELSVSGEHGVEAALEAAAARGVRHLVDLNNLEACEVCALKLRDTLLEEVEQGFECGSAAAVQLVSCVGELSSTAQRFAQAKDEAIGSLASHLRPKLRTLVGDLLDEKAGGFVGFDLNDDEYERARSNPEAWAMRLLRSLDELVEPFLCDQVLSSNNTQALLLKVGEFVGKRLETGLRRHRFSALGALLLDKDVRCIVTWFAARAGRSVKTECFERLGQFVGLLNSDGVEDAAEAWSEALDRGQEWRLSGDEARKVLALRGDFERGAIDQLQLR